jgi:hypothetical protein
MYASSSRCARSCVKEYDVLPVVVLANVESGEISCDCALGVGSSEIRSATVSSWDFLGNFSPAYPLPMAEDLLVVTAAHISTTAEDSRETQTAH